MSFNYKRKWNLYPKRCDDKITRDNYRSLCAFICPNCKDGDISFWNKDFFEMHHDDGQIELTFDDFYCPKCAYTVRLMLSCEPPESGIQ